MKRNEMIKKVICRLVLIAGALLLAATGAIVASFYVAPRHAMKKAVIFHQKGNYEGCIIELHKSLDKSPSLEYRQKILWEMSQIYVSPEYYSFWKDLFVSASRNDKRWPNHYLYTQQDIAFQAMYKSKRLEAIDFGRDIVNNLSTPEFVRRSIERTMADKIR